MVACVSTPLQPGGAHLTVVEIGAHEPVPCRVHLQNADGAPQQIPGLPFFKDHFAFPGSGTLELAPGRYHYEIERGPEYQARAGRFTVRRNGGPVLNIELRRIVDMAARGWWSGELHVHRPVDDMQLLMRAEDLHIAPVITWWNDRTKNKNKWREGGPPSDPLVRFDTNRYMHLMGGEDERDGGALLYFNLSQPLDLSGATAEHPSSMRFLEEARRRPNAWIDVEKPFWWDVPVWLASGKVDSIGLANNHMCRSEMYESEAWGKPRDTRRLQPPRGNGYWTQEIYYHILNCGPRIPPSAGSASGILPNPVGYNRVYVKVEGELTYAKWWKALKAGRAFVTNGPMLIVTANQRLPGHVFVANAGQTVELQLDATVFSREPIHTLQIIKNGQVEQEMSAISKLQPPPLRFRESGWFLVRAIGENGSTFRFASTAPFYVDIGKQRRISRTSAQFFVDWVEERIGRIKLEDAKQRREVLRYHHAAREFWRTLLAKANAQ